jgi:hypothetical protein
MQAIGVALAGILLFTGVLFADGWFDSQEMLDDVRYPDADRGKPDIRRNIGLTLDIYGSFCESKGLTALPEFVRSIHEGKGRLNLRNAKITFREIEAVAYALRINRTVRALDLGGCLLGDAGSRMIRELSERDPEIGTINLDGCCIGGEEQNDWEMLARERKGTNPLAVLGLATNSPFEDAARIYLNVCAEWDEIPRRDTLAILRGSLTMVRLPLFSEDASTDSDGRKPLSPSSFGEIRALAAVFRSCASFRSLIVERDAGSEPGFDEYLEALSGNPSLESLEVRGFTFRADTARKLFAIAGNTPSLLELSVKACDFGAEGTLPELSRFLAGSTNIRRFIFRDNIFRREEFSDLIRVLARENVSVTNLSINGVSVNNDPSLPELTRKFPPGR